MAKKATAHDAQLILKLYDLRREAEMRKARNWFAGEFWPQSADELIKVASAFPGKLLVSPGKRLLGHGRVVRGAGRTQRRDLSAAGVQRRDVHHLRQSLPLS